MKNHMVVNLEIFMKKCVLTVQQFATRHGITDQAVTKALREKRLKGYKFGKKWMILVDEVIERKKP